MDAAENISLSTADGSNPRIDLIVAYVDLSVVSNSNPNNPNALVVDNVTGTPSGSPAVPNAAAIQAVIGASNPYIILARVAVAAGATTITNANITDVRDIAQVDAKSTRNPYRFRGYRSAAATLTASTVSKMVLDAESYDTNNNFSSGTYTVPVTGFYHFSARFSCTTTRIFVSIYKNGSEAARGIDLVYSSNIMGATVTTDLECTAGDTVEMWYFSAGSVSLDVGQALTYFSGHLISPT